MYRKLTGYAKLKIVVVCVLTVCMSLSSYGQSGTVKSKNKTLIIFFDGLRPDYITAAQMPNLYAFTRKASFGRKHHSVFPTVTRVNSASYATGSYPDTHGLLGNAIYIPEVSKLRPIGTGYGDLVKIPAATGQPLLTATSLGEVLDKAGERMMVFSSGTTGQAFLQNHTVGKGAIINPGLILPESFKETVFREIGKVDGEGLDKHRWITDALIRYGFEEKGPLVSAIWFSDPDGAAHDHGMGSPETVTSLQFADNQFGRILESLKSKGLLEHYNIIISTDHGFVTHRGKQSLEDFLIKQSFKKNKESEDVIVAEGAIYVKDHNKEIVKKIAAALHKEPWVGAVFSKPDQPGSDEGWMAGTISFDAIHYNHPERSGDLLVAVNWNDEKNDKNYAGTDFGTGVAGHGGSSPYEVNIALFVSGPDFRKAFNSDLPSSNVDITPTILGIYKLPLPPKMDGRILSEFLLGSGKADDKVKNERIKTEVRYPWGTYKLTLDRSSFGKYRYVNYIEVKRQ